MNRSKYSSSYKMESNVKEKDRSLVHINRLLQIYKVEGWSTPLYNLAHGKVLSECSTTDTSFETKEKRPNIWCNFKVW